MTELSALNVRITGDASDLRAEMVRASGDIKSVATQAQVAQVRTGGMATSFGRLGNVSNRTRAQIQNTSFQLQDIAVQLQGGTKASTALAQQLPQLLGGFGALGAVLGVVAGVGIPALAFAFSAMGKATFDLDAAMKNLEETIGDMKTPMDILQMSTDQLIEKYGQAAERVLRFAHAQAELAASQAASRMSEQVAILDDVTRKYTVANNAGRDYANTIARIGRDFGLAKSEAQQFESMLEEINNAGSLEEQQIALQNVLDFLKDNNIELGKIPDELQRAIFEMITFSDETDRARAIMDQLAQAAAGVAIGGGGRGSVVPNATDAMMASMGGEWVGDTPGGSGGGGGGGGGAPKVNPLIAELEQVEQALMTQEELQLQSYMRQQETLQSALDQRLLTQQEYNGLIQDAQSQHQDKMAQIDAYRYGSGVQQTAKFMGDMANALQGGNEKMLKISRVFAASQALINAWLAYSEVIKDPLLPWFARIPAAAGVLAAGIGAVNAIKGGSKSGGGAGASSAGGSSASAAAPAQQNVQTLNFSVQNDPFGISDRVIRQIVGSINEAQRNGSTLIRATVA